MKSHFLKFIQRGVAKKPFIYSINFVGLTLSMTVVFVLATYYLGETGANKFNKNIDNTYVICSEGFQGELHTYTPAILKEHIENEIPEVEKVVRIRSPFGETTFQVGENPPITSKLILADSTFTDVFSYQCIAGDFKTALRTPMSIVLTNKEALKLFGQLSPIGETVKMDNKHNLTVRAVINEAQEKSSLSFNAIIPMISLPQVSPNGDEFTSWGMSNFTSFVLINKTASPDQIGEKIAQLYPENNYKTTISLKAFSSFYFSDVDVGRQNYLKTGNKTSTTILAVVATIILLMGIINYLNLSFSLAVERLKNVGILKISGAEKKHILKNIIGESALFFLFSVVFAYMISLITIPVLSNKIGVAINSDIILNPEFMLISISAALIISTFSVIVPAIKLSSINPIDSVKRNITGKGKTNRTRTILVITQFSVAIILIAFTWAVQKQVKYGSKQLGFNKENIYTIQLTPQLKKDILKEKIVQIPGVKEVSYTNFLPGRESIEQWYGMTITYKGEKKENISSHIIRCDNNFPGLLGLNPIKGRLFSSDMLTDKNKIIVNKAFVDEYGFDEPLGVKIPAFNSEEMEIIGVVDNFHFQSVHKAISPVIIRVNDYAKFCYVKIASSDFNSLHGAVTQINKAATSISTGYPVDFEFLDESVAQMYSSEVQFRKIFFFFSVIAIFICCLGILGLSIFASQQKVKEIGIRKVNGAKVSEILAMLNKDFVKWVLIAFVIATPVAWYAIHKWLENFAYKTNLNWWIFALAGVLALGIALLTVSWQSWRAATRNPVEALRYE
ncbi:ABC transporter permease [Maribellus maritimus]|uniref:ABC transporter permease n=1 Tax=Maribellus maritimus TaxID=2870838 RepID=UPI001EEA315A|nr:ABC transporter permease [Maribellus maritimus]MCG6189784.1 ABC transporter permease [Maribellus maritimus]